MTTLTIDREAIESFLEGVNNTNFEIIARGNWFEGGIQPAIVKETKIFGATPKTEVRIRYSGYMGESGMRRDLTSAFNAAQGDDIVRAIGILVNSYFYQVELRPLEWVDTLDPQGGIASSKPNPLATTFEPLTWNKDPESGKWGGARPGAGRPKQYIKVPLQTFIGEGTKIEVFSVAENVLFYHIEGQSLTTVDDIYRGSVDDLLNMLLTPIGLTVKDNRIAPASLT